MEMSVKATSTLKREGKVRDPQPERYTTDGLCSLSNDGVCMHWGNIRINDGGKWHGMIMCDPCWESIQ